MGDRCLDAKSRSTGFYGAWRPPAGRLRRDERADARPIGISGRHRRGIMERFGGKRRRLAFQGFPHRNRFWTSRRRDRRRSGSCRSSASWPRGAKSADFVSCEETRSPCGRQDKLHSRSLWTPPPPHPLPFEQADRASQAGSHARQRCGGALPCVRQAEQMGESHPENGDYLCSSRKICLTAHC